MRTLRTREQMAQWKRHVTHWDDYADRVEDAGNLLIGLLSRPRPWSTEAFFDILYGTGNPALQALSAQSLHTGLQLMYFENGNWNAGPRFSMTWQCIRTGRFDVLREIVKRGPPPNYRDTESLPGATTEAGRWLDVLTSRVDEKASFPQTLYWTGIADGGAHLATLLAEVDPGHAGTDCLAGRESGAAFFELVMKRAVAEGLDAAPVVAPGPAVRRRMSV